MIQTTKNILEKGGMKLIWASLFILMMTSCGKNHDYQQSCEPIHGRWTYSDSLVYHFDISDTSQVYNFELGLKHSLDYPFQNIYLEIDAKFPSGHIDKQIRTFNLANKAGNWFGKCDNSGCEYVFPIQKATFFKEKGNYEFIIKQYMRKDTLNVERISLYLDKLSGEG